MVTVIIPAYNCAAYLAQTVESALAQSYGDLEILLLDDCSTDNTLAVAQALAKRDNRLRVIKNGENLGVAQTRNRGIEMARGEWIAFLDGDDLWLPDKLQKQLARLEKTGGDLCYTGYSFMDEAGRPIRRPYSVPEHLTLERLLRENVIGCSTAVFRRQKAKGTFLRGEYAHEDYVFWLELLRRGLKPVGIDEPLMRYRISASNRSGNKLRAAANRWRIYRGFLGMGYRKSCAAFAAYAARGLRKHRSYSGRKK